jgi:NAD(P)-dependent dehydrogenase (short-subunit alcohol dehydrogenase family)
VELRPGQVAVVTGAASGIGRALAGRFAAGGLHVVLADVDQSGLDGAAADLQAGGAEALPVLTDVSDESAVQALAGKTLDRFGAVHVVCNNAGVYSPADPWFGPLSAWQWVMGVNLWGIVHGVRAFLPTLLAQREGHIVNTSSWAGLVPGLSGPVYDATKHAVVALSEDLYTALGAMGSPVGVSVLCPGMVRTQIIDAERNWPSALGDPPPPGPAAEVFLPLVREGLAAGMAPGAVADVVADAISANRFWVFPDPDLLDTAAQRWRTITEGRNPERATARDPG